MIVEHLKIEIGIVTEIVTGIVTGIVIEIVTGIVTGVGTATEGGIAVEEVEIDAGVQAETETGTEIELGEGGVTVGKLTGTSNSCAVIMHNSIKIVLPLSGV